MDRCFAVRGGFCAGILAAILFVPTIALAANSDPFRQGREAVSPKPSLGVGQYTGAMTYRYPLAIPPGRNGVQPDLSLVYSSDDKRQDSLFGYGWSMTLPYIERVNKLGTNNLYNQDKDHTFFTSSLSGELLPVESTTAAGGSFLGTSMSTPLLATIDEPAPAPRLGDPELPPVPDLSTMSVSREAALSFHTFDEDYARPTHVYHPDEWETWNAARIVAAEEARKPIAGFPIVPLPAPKREIPNELVPALANLSAREKATMKGEAIASLGSIAKTRQGDYSIEILSMEPIDGGVQVFARAWDANDRPIGFGKDGSVEIERFRIFNPPILVESASGDITKTSTHPDGTITEQHFREDVRAALLESLAHTITVKKERFGAERIIPGRIGNTTDIYYPDAHPESTSVDGRVGRWGVNETWGTIRTSAGNHADDSGGADLGAFTRSTATTNQWYQLYHSYMLFDTSALPDGDTISSATLSLYGLWKSDGYSLGGVNIASSSPTSNTALTTSDYTSVGTTDFSTDMTISSWLTSAYNDFSLNGTGVAAVSKTGVSKFSLQLTNDIDNSAPTWDSSQADKGVEAQDADNAGTSQDPKLVVEHSAVTIAPSAPTALLVNGLTNPSNISTSSPYFSAIHNNASSTALASSYQIQVSTSTSFSGYLSWDSGKKTLSSSTPPNMRTPNIYSTSTFAVDGSAYYWRIRVWDQYNTAGDWSTTTDLWTTQIAGDYMAKVDDGSMMRYTLETDGSWIAYDKRGWKYTFGATSNARISDPSDSAKIYRWYLEEIADPNGNKVLYRYTKDGGQVYPNYINYTDHGAGDSLYEIDFVRCSEDSHYTCLTSYVATSSIYGFSVLTSDRIGDISVKVNNTVVRRFTPTYSSGDNGVRALLAAIQEVGGFSSDSGTRSADAIVFPSTNFTYQKSTTTWSEVTSGSSWQMTFDVADTSNNDYGWRLFDVNGDALPDWTKADGSSQAVLLNDGAKWATSTAWTLPVAFASGNIDQGVRTGEVNGDGLIDIIAATSSKIVYLNTGSGTWTASSSWVFPESFIDSGNRDQGVQLVDVNGDGLADVFRSHFASTTGTTSKVYINNGFGWAEDAGWSIPEVLITDLKDSAVRLYDHNGDGLVDIIYSPHPNSLPSRVYYDTGRGWERDYTVSVPAVFADPTESIGNTDRGVRFGDYNSDGCVDMAKGFESATKEVFLSNCASGYTTSIQNTLPEFFRSSTSTAYDFGVRMDDIDGDGQIDVTRSYYDSGTGARTRKVYLKNGDTPDLLREVTTSRGGRTTVAYQASPEYRDGAGALLNPNLPLIAQTVRTLATDNGSFLTTNRVLATTTYDYSRGYFYGTNTNPLLRQFAGFGLVTATNTAIGAVTKTYFHQGNGGSDASNGEYNDHIAKAGKPYRTETYDQSGNLYARTVSTWGRADYGDGRNFVKLGRTLTQTFDGDSTHRDTAASTTYNDTTGDITVLVNYGEVSGNSDGTFTDTGTDLASTTYSYAASSTNATMSLPSRELLADQSGTTVRDTKWTYDGLSHGSVTYGNQTKEERLVFGSTYASTTRTYDAYGNVSTSTDPLGNATGFAYDAYNLYPTTVTNALGYQKLASYDYSSGKAATTTDENSQTAATVFDSLDRPIEEKQPDFTTPSTLRVRTAYVYTDATTTPSSVERTDHLSSATSTVSYTYVDGFDRTIQTKREAAAADGWITKDAIYNQLGALREESLPYFTSSSAYAAPTTTASLYVTNAYDALGRVTTVANAVGTTTNTYSDWRLTVTDALGNKKDLNKDAYGNLASVVEYPSAGATTTYTWNLLGKLTKLTDSASNIRNFTYDLLGRLTGSEDLHASGDTTFGTTSRQYDLAGNLLQVYNPRGLSLNYTYDALNRPLTEDSTTTPSLADVVYRYDTCMNGKGRLCEVNAHDAATTTYAYNPIGLVATESRQIGTARATTTTSHLRTGAVDTLTYPDGHQIVYVYDDAAMLNRVLGLTPGTTTWSALIESTTYAPTGAPLVVDYGNNVKTTYTYDATKLYRLTRKFTESTSTTPLSPETLLFLAEALDNPDALLPLLETGTDTTTPNLPAPVTPLLDLVPPVAASFATSGESVTEIAPAADLAIPETPAEAAPVAAQALETPADPAIPTVPDAAPEFVVPAPEIAVPQARVAHEERDPSVTHLWNADIRSSVTDPSQKIAEFHVKQINYRTPDGTFAPIDTNFATSTDGSFVMNGAPFRLAAPAYADGLATFVNDNRFDTRTLRNIDEPEFTSHIQALDAAHVPGHIERGDLAIPNGFVSDVTYVVYPNAYPTADLIYYIHHGRTPRLEKMVRFHAAPEAMDLRFKITSGEALTEHGNALRRGDSAVRGMGFKPFLIWDSTPVTVDHPDLHKEEIMKTLTRDQDGFILTKHLPRAFFENAIYPVYTDATITVYPDANTETNSVDGVVRYMIWQTGNTWSTMHDSSAGNEVYDGSTSSSVSEVMSYSGNTSHWRAISRSFFLFDTSAIPDSETINSATFSLYITSHAEPDPNVTNDLSVVSSTPASNTSLALGDYDLVGTTALSDTLTNANMTDSAYNTLTLNTTGVSSISKSGITKFGLRNHTHDRANDDPSPWTDDLAQTYVNANMADASGTTTDPKLVIVYGVTEDPYTYPAATTLQDLRYTYDAVGNITSLQDLSGTRSYASTAYQYDNLYRLTRASSTQATTTDWLETYTYNDLGNLLTKSDIGSYTYAGTGFANPHAPTTVNGVSYSYDNAGNLTAKGSHTYLWDPWNRLKESSNTGTTTAYTYDHTGQRVSQSINRGSGTTTTLYWSKLYQTEGSTTTLSIFLPDGTLLATVEGNGSATTTSLTHTDHLNSLALTSDKNGNLSELSAYYPYGAHRLTDLPSSGMNVKRGYIGQYEDTATELSYLNARYYDGGRGQFLSQDPMFLGDPNGQRLANPQELNAYSYAAGNPIVWSDPSGRYSIGSSVLDFHLEAGLSLFFAVKLNVSVHYIKDENSEDSWIAPSITFGANIGYKSKSVSFPEAVEDQNVPFDGKPNVFGGSFDGTLGFGGITVSPDTNTPNDLRGINTDSSLTGPLVSLGIQQDQQGRKSFSLDSGAQGPASISTYPTKTWVPEFAVVGPNEIRGATNKISESYRSGLDRIQAQINYLKQEVVKLGESIRRVTNGK